MIDRSNNNSLLRHLTVALGSFAANNSRSVLFSILCITTLLTPRLFDIEYDDDILKFLPEDSPEVTQFQEIGNRFQALSIGLLGIEVDEGDIFTVARMTFLDELTKELRNVPGVAFTASLTETPDIAVETTETGSELTVVTDLVGDLPKSADAPGATEFMEKLKEKILSREHLTGALISESGNAALVLCYLNPELPLKVSADAVQARAEQVLAKYNNGITLNYGGSPFVGSYIVQTTRRDIFRLSLISSLAIITILILTSGSLGGAFIALTSVGIGIVWVISLMGLMGLSLTLVSSSLPMLLLALGSAYSIHIIMRVLTHIDQGTFSRIEAIEQAMTEVGPPICIAALTSAFAFLSFLAMDIQPMREFGLWMFIGTILIVLLALLIVPAACAVIPLKPNPKGRTPKWALKLMTASAESVAKHPYFSLTLFIGLVITAAGFSGEGIRHMTMRDFFSEESEPVKAEDFLEAHLGGSVFMQVQVSGDIKSPLVLHQIERLSALSATTPGVTTIQSIADPIIIASEGLVGEARIPVKEEAVRAIAALIESDPYMKIIVDDAWENALIHIKIKAQYTREALQLIDLLGGPLGNQLKGGRVAINRNVLTPEIREVEIREVMNHTRWILHRAGNESVSDDTLRKALLDPVRAPSLEEILPLVRKELFGDIIEDEFIFLNQESSLDKVVQEVSSLMTSTTTLLNHETLFPIFLAHATKEDRAQLDQLHASTDYILEHLQTITRDHDFQHRQERLAGLLNKNQRAKFMKHLGRASMVLHDPYANLPAKYAEGLPEEAIVSRASLDFKTTGSPVVYDGMNKSVQANQKRCLLISGLLVFLALAVFFRDLGLALVASVPAAFTLVTTFGIMGYLQIPIDVGTSMMTSIAIGIGIDYAVHFLWHHGIPTSDQASKVTAETMATTGWGIIVNALEVAVGFGLLMLGTIVPMKNVGLLTAAAMLISAGSTLALVPALTRILNRLRRA